jgi:hypothetical protein
MSATRISRRWAKAQHAPDTYRCPVAGEDTGAETDVIVLRTVIRKTKDRHFAPDFCLSADRLARMSSAEILDVINGKGKA